MGLRIPFFGRRRRERLRSTTQGAAAEDVTQRTPLIAGTAHNTDGSSDDATVAAATAAGDGDDVVENQHHPTDYQSHTVARSLSLKVWHQHQASSPGTSTDGGIISDGLFRSTPNELTFDDVDDGGGDDAAAAAAGGGDDYDSAAASDDADNADADDAADYADYACQPYSHAAASDRTDHRQRLMLLLHDAKKNDDSDDVQQHPQYSKPPLNQLPILSAQSSTLFSRSAGPQISQAAEASPSSFNGGVGGATAGGVGGTGPFLCRVPSLSQTDTGPEPVQHIIRSSAAHLVPRTQFPYFVAAVTWIVFTSALGAVWLRVAEDVPWIDALFVSWACVTATGLDTVDTSVFSTPSKIVLVILMQLGSFTLMSLAPILFRALSLHRVCAEYGTYTLKHYRRVPEWVVEYKALVYLARIMVAYNIIVYLVYGGALWIYVSISADASRLVRESGCGCSIFGWVAYHVVDEYNNVGLGMEPAQLIPFHAHHFVYFCFCMLAVHGNIGLPIMLRWIIIFLNFMSEKGSSRKVYFRYLLLNGRKCSTLLFGSQQTWVLLITHLAFIAVQVIGALAFSWHDPGMPSTASDKISAAFFMAINTRHSGLTALPLSEIKQATNLIYVLMMFLAPVPFIVAMDETMPSGAVQYMPYFGKGVERSPVGHHQASIDDSSVQTQAATMQPEVGRHHKYCRTASSWWGKYADYLHHRMVGSDTRGSNHRSEHSQMHTFSSFSDSERKLQQRNYAPGFHQYRDAYLQDGPIEYGGPENFHSGRWDSHDGNDICYSGRSTPMGHDSASLLPWYADSYQSLADLNKSQQDDLMESQSIQTEPLFQNHQTSGVLDSSVIVRKYDDESSLLRIDELLLSNANKDSSIFAASNSATTACRDGFSTKASSHPGCRLAAGVLLDQQDYDDAKVVNHGDNIVTALCEQQGTVVQTTSSRRLSLSAEDKQLRGRWISMNLATKSPTPSRDFKKRDAPDDSDDDSDASVKYDDTGDAGVETRLFASAHDGGDHKRHRAALSASKRCSNQYYMQDARLMLMGEHFGTGRIPYTYRIQVRLYAIYYNLKRLTTNALKGTVARDAIFLWTMWILVTGIEGYLADYADEDQLFRPYKNTFAVLFELSSCYGNVGLSLGSTKNPTGGYSFSGDLCFTSKLICISIMLVGRWRDMPKRVDRTLTMKHPVLQEDVLTNSEHK